MKWLWKINLVASGFLNMKHWLGIIISICGIAFGGEISTVAGNGKPGFAGDGGQVAKAMMK